MASIQNSIEIKDKGFKQLLNSVKLLKNSSAKVGILSDAPKTNGPINMATLANIHEFGARIAVTDKMRGWFFHNYGIRLKTNQIVIPARPFMHQTFARIKPMIFDKMMKMLLHVSQYIEAGQTITPAIIRKEFGLVAEYAVAEIKRTFDTGSFAPLSEFTRAHRKGGADTTPKPLQDTGRLKNSITQRVELGVAGNNLNVEAVR